MNIFINEKPADIALDTEKTLGEVMAGIESWIAPTGSRIRGVCINTNEISSDALGDALLLDISGIQRLDICIRPWREFAAEAMINLYETCTLDNGAAFDTRTEITETWLKGVAARFLASEIPELFKLSKGTLTGQGLPVSDLSAILEERLKEITDPEAETSAAEEQVKIVAGRMEEIPLDLQTGKDQHAAETVKLFSVLSEKLFRIFFIHKSEGLLTENFMIDGLPVRSFIQEFNTALNDLLSAYENGDTIFVGDIAEYELGPRLLKFFAALKNITNQTMTVTSSL
jgi:hypothetical protein